MSNLNDQGWWSRFYDRWFGGGKRLDKGSTAEPFTSEPSGSGSQVTAEKALKLSAVWACVRLRSQAISSLPLHLKDGNRKNASDHPLYKIIHDTPNADMCASEFWEAIIANLDLWGNAYCRINRIGGRVVSLDLFDPQYMSVKRSDNGEIIYKYTKNNVDGGEYSEKEILHLRGFTLDGLIGLSPIGYQAQVMGLQMDANNAASKAFKNNLKAGGFLKTGERVLNEDQRKRVREGLSEFGKPENAGNGDTYYLREATVGDMNKQIFETRSWLIQQAEQENVELPPEDDETFEEALNRFGEKYRLAQSVAYRLCDENGVLLFNPLDINDLNAIAELDSKVIIDFNKAVSAPKDSASEESSS